MATRKDLTQILMEGDRLDNFLSDFRQIGSALHRIGLGNASADGWGAIELLSKEIKDGASAISEGLHAIAEAIENNNKQDAA